MEIKGYVEKIVYSNEENGHTILEISMSSEEQERIREEVPDQAKEIDEVLICVGTLYLINAGEYIIFQGEFVRHSTYGLQFKVNQYEESKPEDIDAIERYLASGAVKGIGGALAGRIVRHFKMDTFRIIEEEPEKLSEVKGISERKAIEISTQIAEKKDMRKAMIFLGELGISMNLAVKIYKEYGESLYGTIKKNPYKIADDIQGVGFRIADEIARNSGISNDSPFRIKSGILYTLLQATANGHSYLPQQELLEKAGNVLGVRIEEGEQEDILMDMMISQKIVVRPLEEVTVIYPATLYHTELNIAQMLVLLDVKNEIDMEKFSKNIYEIQKRENILLEEMQEEAVKAAATNGLLVITGGPGTGKTTTINTIIQYFEGQGKEILLAAPTGRAAKRMTEATGYEAQTIHRLLEISGIMSEDSSGAVFEKNQDSPLEADVIIIDEMSMVDIFLMNSLLKAISAGTRLILVGDSNQLPSVGPGNVLKDIISSDRFKVVKLTKIFRQTEAGDIIINAHKINQGERFAIGTTSKDFPFIKRNDANSIINVMVTLIQSKLPKYTNCEMNEVQVLTPTRKGQLGVEKLNVILQQYLNPPNRNKIQKEIGNVIFREGDKVMQIKNNYKISWEIRGKHGIPIEKGMGVFNGDTGVVDNINLFLGEITVKFDEDRYVVYSLKETDELEHAYAITVHKSQGSEYPAVVLPMLDGPRMLMNRNILYTAVTRAKKCVCVVGEEETFYQMIHNENHLKRFSSLDIRIKEAQILDQID